MKKILTIIISVMLLIPINVFASGNYSASAPSSVTNGSNVTFTLKLSNTAAWNVRLSGSGATNGCSAAYADVTQDGRNTTKNLTVTCKANKEGTITFTATGDITSQDGANSNVSISKTVSVVKAREKENESKLADLNIQGQTIDFNPDKFEYSIVVEPTVEKINISATPKSKYASVTGVGERSIDENIEIISTSETGNISKYVITVTVKDSNPIKIKIDGEEYTVIKKSKGLVVPVNSKESTIKIENFDIPSFINEDSNITVIGVMDKDNNIHYATVDNNSYELYNENKSNELSIYLLYKKIPNYKMSNITINEKEYKGAKIDDRFYIVYGMDLKTGKKNYYRYDSLDKTFQHYDINDENSKNDDIDFLVICALVIALFGFAIYSINLKRELNNYIIKTRRKKHGRKK